MKPIIPLLLCALLVGCQTTMPTQSGRPEVNIAASADRVRVEITNTMLNRGYSPRGGDAINLVFDKEAGVAASVFFGSAMDPQVIKRCRFTIVESAGQCRVVAGFAILSASSREESEATGPYAEIQKTLEIVRARLQGEPIPVESAGDVTEAKSPKGK